MMEDIILSLRAEREEFDMDVLYDYTFVAGDMNYRFDSTYEDMMSTNQVNIAHSLMDQYDQLYKSMRGGKVTKTLKDGATKSTYNPMRYPGFQEAPVNFKPTYKRNMDDNGYKNKKS